MENVKKMISMKNSGLRYINNQTFVAFLVLIGLFVLGQILAPGFASFEHIMTILSLASFLGLIAMGQMIVILSGGEGIDLSVGSTISLSAVVAANVLQGQDGNLWLALLSMLFVGIFFGTINGIGIAYFKIPPLVMTLAMASVIQGVSLVYTNGQPKGGASEILKSIGVGRWGLIPKVIVVWFIFGMITVIIFNYFKQGRVLLGVGENSKTAELSGVNTRRVRMTAYILCSVMAAVGGFVLLGYTGTAYLDIGSPYIMPSIAAVVIGGVSLRGGKGGYLGVAVGGLILTTLSSILLTLRMGEGGRQLVYGVVLLLLLTLYSRQKNGK